MIKCMFCNEKLLLIGTSSTLNMLVHDGYKKCSLYFREMAYNPNIFYYQHSTKITRSEYFYYNNICFYFDYNDDNIKLIVNNDSEARILEVDFLINFFDMNLINNALNRVIENLLFI